MTTYPSHLFLAYTVACNFEKNMVPFRKERHQQMQKDIIGSIHNNFTSPAFLLKTISHYSYCLFKIDLWKASV
jgi:hypothetical protein